jgi:AbrB family looped-hinge helix DNA binding protein
MLDTTVKPSLHAKTALSSNGRIVIPAAIRQELGFNSGDTLLMEVEDGVLRIESYAVRIRRVQESLKQYISPDRVLSNELIAERREEARREEEELARDRAYSEDLARRVD